MKICVITGTRAEYGLFSGLMAKIKKYKKLKLQVLATGTHLSKKHGYTYKEIINDGFKINAKVDLHLSNDQPSSILKSMGIGLKSYAKSFSKLKPDLILVIGDRYETFSAAVAAHFSKIPIAHIHGGESTEGSLDEALRHSISKMSYLHFVAAKKYKETVVQLGENPKRVFNVGGLGADNIKETEFLKLAELQKILKIKFRKKNLIINYHPATLKKFSDKKDFNEVLKSLKEIKNCSIIFTMPNSDQGNQAILTMMKHFIKKNKNAYFFKSMGKKIFLSCLKYTDCMIGNSSSGLLEMPYFKKATINIGDRQKGRIVASSVINTKANQKDIIKAINKVFSKKFHHKLKKTKALYGNGNTSLKIIKILKKIKIKNIYNKSFYRIKN